MSLNYFIDGYNVIRSNDRMSEGRLQQQRERLLRLIEEANLCGKNQATVVFDGKPGRDWTAWRGPTRVVFSMERDADTEIKDRVDGLSNAAAAVVVTNDRAIQKWVRGAGAKILSCEEFLSRRPHARGPSSGSIDPQTAAEINEEMKRIWKLK